MIIAPDNIHTRELFYRITALWVICEAFAGGIMHGIKIPFSGLMVSSLAVFCIILLAWYIPSKTAIFKATLIVAIFKLMLSPHAPPTAYIAVFFQGLMGQLFLNKSYFGLSAIIVAVLSLVESAIQRILVLVVLYGNDFWKAVNEFIAKVTGDKTINNYSLLLAGGYIFIHAIVGIFVGYYAAKLVTSSGRWKSELKNYIIKDNTYNNEPLITRPKKKKKKLKIIFLITWLLLLAFYLQSQFDAANAFLPKDKVVQILVRSALIIIAWYLFVSPLMTMLIKKALIKRQQNNKEDMNATMQLLPEIKMIFQQSWQLSAAEKSFNRLKFFPVDFCFIDLRICNR
ncbi:MAG: hypothetical protein EOP53_10670 [Sphingobacteriales bacterium]|nr:MAG: hypothetical protein EOP53_10670 [Sphingobacteriales bacterium]